MKNLFRFFHPAASGFTLLELLVSVGIFALLISSIVGVYLSSNQGQRAIWGQLTSEGDARRVLKDFTAEARTAAASATGAYPIERADNNEFIFYSNIDADSARERVRYFLSGTMLKKGIVQPTGNPPNYNLGQEAASTLASYVVNGAVPVFTYYNESYTGSEVPLAMPVDVTKVRVVGLSLWLSTTGAVTSTSPLQVRTQVGVRNLKSN